MTNPTTMRGFMQKFKTPVDYIVEITREIWEDGGIDLIEGAYYSDPCPVYTPLGVSTRVADVTSGTRATLVEFPDRHLLADDVIIGEKPDGFYSSHRVRSTATHLGPGRFGPPSGRVIGMLTIADCVCRENRIVEEWLVRDQAGIARQVGLDPKLLGAEIGRSNRAQSAPGAGPLLARWADAAGLTVEGDAPLARQVMAGFKDVWGSKDLSQLSRHYDRAVRLEAPGAEVYYGLHSLEPILRGFIAAIPDGVFKLHHVIARRDPGRAPRVALRWSYAGSHTGQGRYGIPSHVPLVVLGITHVELRDEKIIAKWMLVDELSIYAQIAGARG
jgi:predicted ester cyclase